MQRTLHAKAGMISVVIFLLFAFIVSSCGIIPGMQANGPSLGHTLIPAPVSYRETGTAPFTITDQTRIIVELGSDDVLRIGQYLADVLSPSTGFNIDVVEVGNVPSDADIHLRLGRVNAQLGEEGYELSVDADSIALVAGSPAGLFRGIQTIRQLLPPDIESTVSGPGPWQIPSVHITDYPRFEWRGAMLDVARHFFSVADVKRYIDLLSYYKMNRLHLHLSDDQGWRVMINSWPELATRGGTTAVGGGPGGYYTQDEYADIVAYARERFITIVPEIDMPGHTNAALASYGELNCDGKATELYTGIEVGFSSLCVDKEITYEFVDDVVRELAALTTGPYIHIGGDEVQTLSDEEYRKFMERVQEIVVSHGKQAVGWDEIAQSSLLPSTIVQHWASDAAAAAVAQGAKMIMSPASRTYLDMKYDPQTTLGLNWAGYIEVDTAYIWDPAEILPGVSEDNIIGVEAPLWTETIDSIDDIEFMAFPRVIGITEIGWSPREIRSWDDYRLRLAEHGTRLTIMEVDYYQSPLVPWID